MGLGKERRLAAKIPGSGAAAESVQIQRAAIGHDGGHVRRAQREIGRCRLAQLQNASTDNHLAAEVVAGAQGQRVGSHFDESAETADGAGPAYGVVVGVGIIG